ncbi:hypothetical protein IOD13_05160 [Brevibacterium casei]|nr:hypothetical protein [Brevibacterium casei]
MPRNLGQGGARIAARPAATAARSSRSADRRPRNPRDLRYALSERGGRRPRVRDGRE